MTMERYEAYKDSGVEWIGEIPEGWQLRRISAFYDSRNEKVSDQDYPPLSVTMQGIVPQLETAAKTQDGDNRKLVRRGDFVINSRSDRRGSCGISAYDGSVTLISNVLAPKERNAMSTRYYSHLFRSEGFADEFYRQGTGIVDDLWSTNWTRMKNILVARPPRAEQERIADYLDARTAEIDALIADCEREVELLQEYRKAVISEAVTKGLDPAAPMKDSGIEWIGEIPADWACANLGAIAKQRKNLNKDGEVDNVLSLSYGNIRRRVMDNTGLLPESFNTYNVVEDGDVVLRLTDLQNDQRSLRVGLCQERGIITAAYTTLEPQTIDSRYLFYSLAVFDYWKGFYGLAGGVRQSLTFDGIRGLRFTIPSRIEQQAIADYLDAKTTEIDSLIDAKKHMADKLREYRRSLISEAVTGKFKVPGVK